VNNKGPRIETKSQLTSSVWRRALSTNRLWRGVACGLTTPLHYEQRSSRNLLDSFVAFCVLISSRSGQPEIGKQRHCATKGDRILKLSLPGGKYITFANFVIFCSDSPLCATTRECLAFSRGFAPEEKLSQRRKGAKKHVYVVELDTKPAKTVKRTAPRKATTIIVLTATTVRKMAIRV
jgi:hypothetical protein